MRPLAIWAMQWALAPPKLHKEELQADWKGKAQMPHLEFSQIASFLKLPKEKESKSIVRVIYEIAREKLWK
ncbi:hypothetical protein BHM03_00018458 [Ensete ventricosum]|nr:hypothetical protein BHM03_00018458 [Ensete ventricosum]